MENISFIEQLQNEIHNMDFINFVITFLIFYIPFHFSKKANDTFLRVLFGGFGIYMLLTMDDVRIIYDLKMLVGLGLLIPQLRFLYYFIQDTIQTIKMMSTNTYYFFVTLYYKILRFFNWLKSTYIMFKTFFTTFSFKKEDYHHEQSSQENNNYKQDQKFYEESKQEQQNKYNHQKQSYTQEESQNNSQNKTHYETDKFAQFYSESVYVVLGVSADDDFKTIKKAYRNLVRKYHPDLHPNELEKYTEITQLINNAYEKIQRWKK